jgi:hypothetical protein
LKYHEALTLKAGEHSEVVVFFEEVKERHSLRCDREFVLDELPLELRTSADANDRSERFGHKQVLNGDLAKNRDGEIAENRDLRPRDLSEQLDIIPPPACC